jgi:glycosyltransferase involved in cell wall biosynthesis
MRIGIITDAIDNKPTGIGVYVENLVENLLKIDKLNEYVLIHHELSHHPLYAKTKELRYPFIPKIPKMLQDSLFLSMTKEKFDAVYKPNPTGFLFPVPFKKILSVFDLSVLALPELTGMPYRYLYRQSLKVSFRNADHIISSSKFTSKEVIKYFPEVNNKISTIYPGIPKIRNLKNYSKKINSIINKSYLLYVGTLNQRKNINALLDIFININKSYPSLSLVLAGKEDDKSISIRIHKLIKSYNILWTDYIEEEELSILIKNAKMLIYPSFYEGFGFPPLEAMSLGCPVISSNSSSLPEIMGKAGIMVNPYDKKTLEDAIINVLSNTELRNNMIKLGYFNIKRFRWEKCARELMVIFQNVIQY